MISRSTDVSIVAAQLTCWALLLFVSDLAAVLGKWYFWVIVVLSLAWMVSSQIQLGRSYSSFTRPRPPAVFVSRGVYRFVRHPIYTGLLSAGLAFVVSSPTGIVATTYLALVLVTNARAGIEEQMLSDRYPEYTEYRTHTKRYIPFVI